MTAIVRIALWSCLLLSGLILAPGIAQASPAELIEQLGSRDGSKRHQAFRQLRADKPAKLVAMLGKHIELFERHGQELACNLLRSQPIESTRALYNDLLKSEHAYLRAVSATALSRDYELSGRHARRERTIAVMNATGNLTDARVLAQVRAFLVPTVRPHIAIATLRYLLRRERRASEATTRAVAPLVEAKQPQVRAAALAYLSRQDHEHALAFAALLREHPRTFWPVRDLLRSDHLDAEIVDALAVVLAAPPSKHDIGRLAKLVRRHSPNAAARALRKLLGHDKQEYREAALEALADLPGGLRQKDLEALLHDSAVPARIVAAESLRRRDDRSGLAVVIALLPQAGKHKAEATRVLAGFRAKQAVPVLLDLLDDRDVDVRVRAWGGVKDALSGLFPYRKFDFARSGYEPRSDARSAGIAVLRTWWDSARTPK